MTEKFYPARSQEIKVKTDDKILRDLTSLFNFPSDNSIFLSFNIKRQYETSHKSYLLKNVQ